MNWLRRNPKCLASQIVNRLCDQAEDLMLALAAVKRVHHRLYAESHPNSGQSGGRAG